MNLNESLDPQTSIMRLRGFSAHWTEQIQGWREEGEKATEKKFAQSFWSDLLRCFGIMAERIALFEREATRASTGNNGWIDFFMPSIAIGEAKSLDKNLDVAMEQVDDYLAGGSITQAAYPRWALVTNFETFKLRRLDQSEDDIEFDLIDIAAHYEDLVFLNGQETVSKADEKEASIAAAKIMANLFVTLTGDSEVDIPVGENAPKNESDEDAKQLSASILMTRLLFLVYGDDSQLWERDLFFRWVERETNASNLGVQLRFLFEILNSDFDARPKNLSPLLQKFPYVNGGVFEANLPMIAYDLDLNARDALLEACRFKWTRISVAVFGSMFQLVKSKEARRGDGEHYTSEVNIKKTLDPLFLNDYRQRADRLIRNKSTTNADFNRLIDEMAANIYCDPACGSGNFLSVAYAELRDIETSLLVEKKRRFGEVSGFLDATSVQRLTIDRFYGFELNWWPAKIAETAMFLVDHQSNQKLSDSIGLAPNRLPIEITAHIRHGNAIDIAWDLELPRTATKTYIFGNPPFSGHKKKKEEQRNELKKAWDNAKGSAKLDYVTAWHAKAIDFFETRQGEFAFVTTNSIAQGQSVAILFGSLFHRGWRIKFAHRTFKWDSEAPGVAGVSCVIIGFTRDGSAKQHLWDYPDAKGEPRPVKVHQNINGYLLDGPNVLVGDESRPLSSEIAECSLGTMPLGPHLLIDESEYELFSADPIASKYLRKFVGADELVKNKRRWCLWMAGEDFDPADINRSALLKSRVEANRHHRTNSESKKGDAYKNRETPHLFRPNKSRPIVSYLCIPRHVTETRRYFTVQRFEPEVIAGDANFTMVDEDGLQFSIISSSMFIAWQRMVGGALESRLRFAKTLTWYTFPMPELGFRERQKIIRAGQKVLEMRALSPERSLEEHYNPLAMEPALIKAHNALDREIDLVFGADRKLTNELQRQEILFDAYQGMTSSENVIG